jgi:hypothetical protein
MFLSVLYCVLQASVRSLARDLAAAEALAKVQCYAVTMTSIFVTILQNTPCILYFFIVQCRKLSTVHISTVHA